MTRRATCYAHKWPCHSEQSEESTSIAHLPSSNSHLPSCHSERSEESPLNPQPSTLNPFDAIVLGVAHQEFLNLDLNPYLKENAVVYDVKGILPHADAKL